MTESLRNLLEASAEAHEAAAQAFRRRIALLNTSPPRESEDLTAVDLARAIHPTLGPRQAQLVELLGEAGPSGSDTGTLSRSLEYDQPNVYLTLAKLAKLGIVEKDESTKPHTYRLSL